MKMCGNKPSTFVLVALEREREVTHFVEVLFFHSDSTDVVTGVEKFILQKNLLLDTRLKHCG